jgi:hypothetical protein
MASVKNAGRSRPAKFCDEAPNRRFKVARQLHFERRRLVSHVADVGSAIPERATKRQEISADLDSVAFVQADTPSERLDLDWREALTEVSSLPEEKVGLTAQA